MKAKVNPRLCDGSGLCEEMCPEVFEVHAGLSIVRLDDVPVYIEQSCREAADGCPVGAISLDE